jgi:hypothetical protein
MFPGRWIGRGSANDPLPIRWPAYSPDLTPCDFFYGDTLKALFTVLNRPILMSCSSELRPRLPTFHKKWSIVLLMLTFIV